MALWKFSAREIHSRPGRTLLTLLSIVLGVAAVVSVSVATNTTRAAYQHMYQTLAGRSDLEVVADGSGGVAETLIPQLEKTPGVEAAVPVIQRPAIMYYGDKGRIKILTLAVDPERDEALEDYDLVDGELFGEENGVLIGADFARGLHLKVGEEVRLFTPRGRRVVKIVGLLAPRGVAGLGQGGVLFLPLKRAQNFFKLPGRVDAINIVLDHTVDETTVLTELGPHLPDGVTARRPIARTQLADETLRASEQGLRVATALSLVVAAFIILNTFLMNVHERRRQISVLRAIGATRTQVVRLLLLEGLSLGIAGALLGTLAGLAGAYGLTRAMEQLFQAPPAPLHITAAPLLLAAGFGVGVSLVAAYLPARKAGRVSPLEGMRSVQPDDVEAAPRWVTRLGATSFTLGMVLLTACIFRLLPPDWSVYMCTAALAGLVLLIPLLLGPLSRLTSAVFAPLLGLEGVLASRQILRRRMRTGLTIAVLFIAITAGIGMANSVIDNIRDVNQWYQQTVAGDFFVRVMMPDLTTGVASAMPEKLGDEIRRIQGVARVDMVRLVSARAQDIPVVIIVKDYSGQDRLHLDLKNGEPRELQDRMAEGEVVLGTVLAQRLKLEPGDEIAVETKHGTKQLRVAATANEYLVGGLVIYMDRSAAKDLFDVQGADAFIVTAEKNARPAVEKALRAFCDKHGLLFQSYSDLIQLIDRMMAGIVGSLWVLMALGFVVAAFGIVNTLMMNVLEQTREIGLLRAVAMTRAQVRKTILAQAAIMGVIGLAPGIFTGEAMAYLMNLTTLPLLGRSIKFGLHPALLLGCFFGGLVIVLLAAYLPAQRATRLVLAEALHAD